MNAVSIPASTAPGKPLRIALWAAQVILAVLFCAIGVWKLTTPIETLAAAAKWAGEFPPAFVRTMGVVDFAGGLGVLLPALTRIRPQLTVLAAAGCTALQICATVFHLWRGEASVLPLNALLLGLSVFVWWGRARRAPIAGR